MAISIYFAIMRVNPPPFCVLDEIEAALDDVNVARFAQYLRRMSRNSQFITITHRRGTMEGSDMLLWRHHAGPGHLQAAGPAHGRGPPSSALNISQQERKEHMGIFDKIREGLKKDPGQHQRADYPDGQLLYQNRRGAL